MYTGDTSGTPQPIDDLRRADSMSSGKLQRPPSPLQAPRFNPAGEFHSKTLAPQSPRPARDGGATPTLTPSAFLREMALTTEQRLANTREGRPPHIIQLLDMSETTHQKCSAVDLDRGLFQPFPSEIVFQNYTSCETYKVPLVLRNNDKVPRLVKVIQESSPYFQVISPNDVCHKVAPGMASTFHILFTPEENKDYFHEVICVTEREKFVVPIRALGARALLDFPDHISFQICPVKYNSQKTLLVRNIGNRDACFCLLTQRPFSVEPASATLAVGESMQVVVQFQPETLGDHSQTLTVRYDTGEDVIVSLYGAATDVNVRLDKNSLMIEKTYVSLANQRMVTIVNRSDIITHFRWKAVASLQEEEQQKSRLCLDLHAEEEMDHFLEECSADPSLRERLSLLSRTFRDRRRMVQEDAMLFTDDVFHIEPAEGDVWPNSSLEVRVLFKPEESKMYQRTVYCDITGREARIPLRIRGEGLGPKLLFNFHQLDVGKIFVGSTHSYEVILTNEGAIDGIFTLIPPATAVASFFTFDPSEGIVLPGGHQAIQIRVCGGILGEFCHEFCFSVDGSPESLTLTLRGCVIGPTFHFSAPALHFGDVSFGFPQTLTCSLNNTSLVPMTFSLRVPGDGSGEPSIASSTQVLGGRNWSSTQDPTPREFSITPSRGTIRSQGLLEIEVTFCPSHVKRYELALVVDVEGIGDEVLALPITARCAVPSLCVEDPVLSFGRCFLRYPYQRTVTLTNPSHLPGCYGLVPQESPGSAPVRYSSPMPRGVIEPHSSVELPVIIEAQETGDQSVGAHIAVFGHVEPLLDLRLLCTGEGPVVHVCPSEVDFGDTPVLTDVSRTLVLSNQAPIPAAFNATLARKRSVWRIEPRHGEIPPEGKVCVTLVANLDDTISFTDTLQLAIKNSSTYHIPLRAVGTGTTIVTDRTFTPLLDLGAHFSAGPCRYHFTMTNRGRRTHQLYWMTEGFPQFRSRPQLPTMMPEPLGPVFKLHPSRMELHPGQSIEVLLEGSSDLPRVVKERLLGQAIIGKQSGKEKIMTVDVICSFIAPVLNLSARRLHFYAEKQPDDILEAQYQHLTLKNVSSLPLTIFLSLSPPFSVCSEGTIQPADTEAGRAVAAGEETQVTVRFDPTYIRDLRSRVAEEVLMISFAEHPHTDSVSLHGEVHFPNLHFSSTIIDFGCILNDTETTRELEVTNCSPCPVRYHWLYQTDDCEIRRNKSQMPETNGPHASQTHLEDLKDAVPCGGTDVFTEGHPAAPEPPGEEHPATGVEEVFDILPLFGTLQPGESQTTSFTFYGHAGISAHALALCKVHGGPTYEISLHGEASLVSYTLSTTDIDYGVQLFDKVAEADIVLRNTGPVTFPFSVINTSAEGAARPGKPLVQPLSGHVAAGGEEILKVFYFPGVPESFHHIIQLQVAHLEPQNITVRGEGVFHRICLDLPRDINENETLQAHIERARETIRDTFPQADTESLQEASDSSTNTLLLMEVERLLVHEHATQQLALETSDGTRHRLHRALLPDYLLDFGFVILGDVCTHFITITNIGHFPVSFRADRRGLAGTGFSTELDRVKNLPRYQTDTFQVKFDPRGGNLSPGPLEVLMPVQVIGGPAFPIRLRACVTVPRLSVSSDVIDFDPVQCGQCQIRSVQLYNQFSVPCQWAATRQENEAKIDKHTPMHLRKKRHQDTKPGAAIFEMIPASGALLPGEKKNVEIKFVPREEKLYKQSLVLRLVQSSHRVALHVRGQGLEPRLEFSPSVLELGPVLPFSPGASMDVLVRNPCAFPIEFYSLEMDAQYLEEDKVLGMLKGYDAHNTLLLPPRLPGEKLPTEILHFYEEKKRLLEDNKEAELVERGAGEDTEEDPASDVGQNRIPSATTSGGSHPSGGEGKLEGAGEGSAPTSGKAAGEKVLATDGGIQTAAGELENNPVSRAIARYLGIDTSSEGRASTYRRGITIIVYGAPLTGKSSAAVALAQHYNIPCLSIDSVVIEALSDSNSPNGLKARQLCSKASLEQTVRELEETAPPAAEVGGQPRLSVEALAKHAAEGGQGAESKGASQSVISRGNRGSLMATKGKSDSHPVQGAKQPHLSELGGSQTGTSPIPRGRTHRRLSVSASVGGEMGLVSCVLPEDLLQDIVSERLQVDDCFRGVVFDGLDSLFARNPTSSLQILLKALNNRRHIYLINLQQEYAGMRSRELAQRQHKEQEMLRAVAQEKAEMEEMDEEEYDALPSDRRSRIDELRLQALRQRKERESEERLAREERERRMQEELLKQREEEELRKKMRRGKSRDSGKEDTGGKKSQMASKQVISTHPVKSDLRLDSGLERKVSLKERPESVLIEGDDPAKKRRSRDPLQPGQNDLEKDSQEADRLLMQRFHSYESCQRDILHVLTFWDRLQGILLTPTAMDDAPREGEEQERQAPSGKRHRRDRERQAEKERADKERLDRLRGMEGAAAVLPTPEREAQDQAAELKPQVGVPHFDFHVTDPCEPIGQRILQSGKLPSADEILDGLGLGPSGPPLPPPCLFSVIPFPERRAESTDLETLSHFTFIAASTDDPNVIPGDKQEAEPEAEPVLTLPMLKEEQLTPTKGRSKKDKSADTGRESQKDKRRPASQRKGQQPAEGRSPPPDTRTPLSDFDQGSTTGEGAQGKLTRLGVFRWVVPAGGDVTLRLHFTSTTVGNFDQTLNFELLGTRRRYSLYCRGVCAFPSISQDPRVVFPCLKKDAKPDDIVHKKFIVSRGGFEFGPLLCGKSREKYKAGQYPENMQTLAICNVSPMESEITFTFQYDVKATTFILDPPRMRLQANEKQELSVWAYPTSPGVFEDSVVCCIKDNPQPAVFRVTCRGVRPELELDRKHIHFDKILLHRRDTRTVFLRNGTLLPAAWRLTGLENLGDEFSVSQDQGIVGPRSEYGLQMHFRAARATSVKKSIRLEVSDVDNVLGMVQLESIQVVAEAYDVALDISFPKGTDSGLDFGVLKVNEEAKHTISLKNKGKYEIGFSFSLVAAGPGMPDLSAMFNVLPQKGSLGPSDRSTQVQILFQSKKEVEIVDRPILHCQVIEPGLCEGGETIASIPIRVSVRSTFSRYRLSPSSDIHFGAMVVGSRRLCSFTIENTSPLEFRYSISKLTREAVVQPARKGLAHGGKRSRSREGSGSSRSLLFSKAKRNESQLRDTSTAGQARVTLGVFTVSPGFGSVPPGAHHVVSVDCFADQLGRSEELLAIEISDRDPEDHPGGIPFRLVTEVCAPGFVTDDPGSIFEEHLIVADGRTLQGLPSLQAGGVYLQEENRFLFCNVLVGQSSTARFKILNPGKVACDVLLALKPSSSKPSYRIGDVFEIEPQRMSIPSHSHSFASVTFNPHAMQTYQCVFEASVEGVGSVLSKPPNLTFEVSGEGNLPRVTVVRPALRTKRGSPLLLFQRLLVGQSQQLPLVLKNEGTITAQVNLDLPGDGGVFSLKPRLCTPARGSDGDTGGRGRRAHSASLILHAGDTAAFHVTFRPAEPQRSEVTLRMSVLDNPYEETSVLLLGEGYQEDLTLDNIHSPEEATSPEAAMEDEVIQAPCADHIAFGDCHVGRPYHVTFTMTNRSLVDAMRFEWPSEGPLLFSPKVGHIHAACSKHVTLTLQSDVPVALSKWLVRCSVARISFSQPLDSVPDWDDGMRTLKWIQNPGGPAGPSPTRTKVIDPEPPHTVLGSRELHLLVSAAVDHAQYRADCHRVHFTDTLLYQTRVYRYRIQNVGSVRLHFSWRVDVEGQSRSSSGPGEEPLGSASASSPRSGPGSVMESVSSLVTPGVDTRPFCVLPSCGLIPAGDTQEFLIKFSPVEVGEFVARLTCSIPNLQRDQQAPVLSVKGRSLLPYCHFQLEDSDYITSGRRNTELGGPHGAPGGSPLNPNTKVMEFMSVGVRTRSVRGFSILNPTGSPYSFLWTCDAAASPQESPTFRCLRERGVIRPEKKVEVSFEFAPHAPGVTESLWSFSIPELNVSVPFLLVGRAIEPRVCLDRSHLNFGSLLVGQEAQRSVYVMNNEEEALAFSVREDSCYSEGRVQRLTVRPMAGTVPPHARVPVCVAIRPSQVGDINVNLICDVQTKMEPLCLNVKAEGHSTEACVQCQDTTGAFITLTSQEPREIDLGQVDVNDCRTLLLHVVNKGHFPFTFSCVLSAPPGVGDYLSVTPSRGCVEAGQQTPVSFSFRPTGRCVLKDTELCVKIEDGPEMRCGFLGAAVTPGLHFSFTRHNFGNCFIYRAGMRPVQKTLVIINKDHRDVSVDCLYSNTAHFEVDFQPGVLSPGEKMEIPITFFPRSAVLYQETVTFQLNGHSPRPVHLRGQGIEMKVEAGDPKYKVTNFGAVRVGQTVKKSVPVVNRSPCPVTCTFTINPNAAALQDPKVLSVLPSSEVTIPPNGGVCRVEVQFSPQGRVAPFAEEVLMDVAGAVRSLLMLCGSSQGLELSLDPEYISFGAVVLESQTTRRIVLSNTGELGARFQWDTRSLQPDFSISPVSGYVTAGAEVTFDVIFHPREVNSNIHRENVGCHIEGSKALSLTLCGSCIGPPSTKEVVTFQCPVRSRQTQTILLSNKTSRAWDLRPSIDGEHWTGADVLTVEAQQQNKPYEITYYPLTMSSEGKKHQGSVFFPLPDGTGLMYLLQGVAEPPKSSGNIVREVPCKTPYTELLSVTNWLNKPQRFRVVVEMLKPERPDCGTSIKGLDYMEVPGAASRDYKLSFHSHKEGSFSTKVIFRNEKTQEYLFYFVTFKATPPGIVDSIEMVTPVRQSTATTLKVENPLSVPVTFITDCKVPEINLPPQLTVPAQSKGSLMFEYQPLKAGESSGRLTLQSADLGLFQYELLLRALPALAEKPLHFHTTLGSSQTLSAKFTNYTRQKTEYSCKVDHSDFHVEKTVMAAPGSQGGSEVSVEVTYEPVQLGETRASLLLSSSLGGEYTIPLFGSALSPKPQGPLQVRSGSTISIPFKNVFLQPTTFTFQADPAAFTVKPSEHVRPKKTHHISVSYEAPHGGSKVPVTGKLVISCPRATGTAQGTCWVYYLKGVDK